MPADYRAYITKIRDLKQDIRDSLSFTGWERHVNKGDTVFGKKNGVFYVESFDAVLAKAMEFIENGKIGLDGQQERNFVKSLIWDELTDIFQQTLMSRYMSDVQT